MSERNKTRHPPMTFTHLSCPSPVCLVHYLYLKKLSKKGEYKNIPSKGPSTRPAKENND